MPVRWVLMQIRRALNIDMDAVRRLITTEPLDSR